MSESILSIPEKQKSPGRFKSAIGKLWDKIKNPFIAFHERFVSGSIGTKLSHFIMGSGNLYHRQVVKGLFYLILQALFFLFMIMCPEVNGTPFGFKALGNLALQGHEARIDPNTGKILSASDSKLMLLFGLVTIIIIIAYLFLWLSNIKSSYLSDERIKTGLRPTTFIQDLKSLLDDKFHITMLTPTCIAALAFTVLPTIFMICMAFTTYNDFDMTAEGTVLFHWNGLTNFINMFTGKTTLGSEIKARFFPVLGWTFIWAIFATITCYFCGILLALLINKKGIKGKKIFRTIFILTIAIPQFISLLAMRNLLGANGPINALLMNWFNLTEPINFLGLELKNQNVVLTKFMVILINMWVGVPYTMLMTSGILLNIPSDLYEAATVDGASKPKMFFKITLPYVVFVTTPYLISSFIGNINAFNSIFLLTGGGPSVSGGTYKAGQTDLLVTWLYKLTIDNGDYNTGAVIGILTFIITATITLVAYRNSKAYKEEDTFQ